MMQEKRSLWILGTILIIVVLLALCTCCIGASGLFFIVARSTAEPYIPTVDPYNETPYPENNSEHSFFTTPTPIAPPTVAPLSDDSTETLNALHAAIIPERDQHELAVRFMGVSPDTPRVVGEVNPDYRVGTRRRFNVSDVDNDRQFEIDAILYYKTEHVYMWVEDGIDFNEKQLQDAADLFEQHTYPTNREFFGSEWSPGVDGDPHLSILHARNLGNTVAGYFSSTDSSVQAVRVDSNEMEMFYINVSNITIGDDFYNGVLAHEFQHMIHWHNDLNEETWLNEGCSELAMALNDRAYPGGYYDVGGSHYAYLNNPDTQLNTWPEGSAGDASANYGGAYLFMEYFLERFGETATQELVAHPANGMESVDEVLQDHGMTHTDFFADWTIANLLDNEHYGYSAIDFGEPDLDQSFTLRSNSEEERTTVHQYGIDYIEVKSKKPVHFTFQGSTQSRLMDTDAYSGKYLWWSNRDDESDARLTHIIDLRSYTTAELTFSSWYHIEEDWDYAYLVVGTTLDNSPLEVALNDPDKSSLIQWTILDDDTLGCTMNNPNNNSFGCGFTGKSNGWESLKANLTPYAGQEIALRFEYITDAAVNQSGFAIDDVEVIANGQVILSDDIESDKGDWIAEGFLRHANIIPQEWIVQAVIFSDTPTVERLIMLDTATGEWTLPLNRSTDRAIITVSAIAPVTTETATYEYTLTPVE
ncbi:MAG: immune inhibitor A [Anaerolineae bacterium]|nr:immune inhibitor A [Anaerolineae bacterium]